MAVYNKEEGPEPIGGAHSSNEAPVDVEKAGLGESTFQVHPSNSDARLSSDNDSGEFQGGIQRVRGITASWTKQTLIIMFILLWLVSFVDALVGSIQGALNPYITSEFGSHGLLAAVSVVPTIISGCSKLTLAKICDIFGRLEGFAFMLLIVIVGLIMKAACENVETYMAAHTLYWTGHIGLLYVVDVMVADITSLRNRMIIFGINGLPLVCSTFAGPKIADLFYYEVNFRWAFGAFAIITLGVCIPVMIIMHLDTRKAFREGHIVKRVVSGRKWYQSIYHYMIEFDVVGILFITAAFSLILLPFSIASYAPDEWATPYIIAMEVVGVICFAIFYVWELKYAPVQFLPFKYLKNPTIIGSCFLYGIMFMSTFIWNAYFGSYLQVVNRLDITTANYVLNSYSLSSAIFAPLVGVLIRYTGEFKYAAYAGIPLMLLGTALIIPFRSPDTHVGLLTMTQILVGIGSAFMVQCAQLAIMAPVTHQEVAVVIAIWGLFGSIGSSLGFAVAGGMWNNILPAQLEARLPEESKHRAREIFGSLIVQMSFADGTPERDAVVGAYADVMRKMAIAGTALMPLIIIAVYVWRNVNVKKMEKEEGHQQTKGVIY